MPNAVAAFARTTANAPARDRSTVPALGIPARAATASAATTANIAIPIPGNARARLTGRSAARGLVVVSAPIAPAAGVSTRRPANAGISRQQAAKVRARPPGSHVRVTPIAARTIVKMASAPARIRDPVKAVSSARATSNVVPAFSASRAQHNASAISAAASARTNPANRSAARQTGHCAVIDCGQSAQPQRGWLRGAPSFYKRGRAPYPGAATQCWHQPFGDASISQARATWKRSCTIISSMLTLSLILWAPSLLASESGWVGW